jgi:hypothetical protein
MGLGGSFALCDHEANLSVAVTVNRLSLDNREACTQIMELVYKHYGLGQFGLVEGPKEV